MPDTLNSFRVAAREILAGGERVAVDAEAPVLQVEGGAQVQCWVFVSDAERADFGDQG